MRRVSTSAPGKILLAGEYAVLDGAPAICMAVNRRASVSIAVTDADEHRLSAPGFLRDDRKFSVIGDIEHDVPLLAAAWRQFLSVEPIVLHIEIDTSDFQSGGDKLGIGSSAAATVALVAAFDTLLDADCDVLQTALTAHRDLQGGRGSGADGACSVAGGVVEYRMHALQTRGLLWPDGLHCALLWSGQPSSTVSQLEKLRNAGRYESATALVNAVEDIATAWRIPVAENILALMRAYAAALQHYDDDHGLEIYATGHADLATLAESTNVVYKPCGAGGGDLGVALAVDETALHSFVAMARDKGFRRADLAVDPVGVTVESNQR